MTAAVQPREDAVQQRQLAPLRSGSLNFNLLRMEISDSSQLRQSFSVASYL